MGILARTENKIHIVALASTAKLEILHFLMESKLGIKTDFKHAAQNFAFKMSRILHLKILAWI